MADEREIAVLRALGSSVRQEILELLGRGPATSAMLARALSSNTGVMSYHLRELGKAGIIEPDIQRGRARYWRLTREDIRFHDAQLSSDSRAAQNAIDRRMAHFNAAIAHYRQRDDLEPVWREASRPPSPWRRRFSRAVSSSGFHGGSPGSRCTRLVCSGRISR